MRPILFLCLLPASALAAPSTTTPLPDTQSAQVQQWRTLFATAAPVTDGQLAFENYWDCAFRSTNPAESDTYSYTRMFHREGLAIWSTDTSSNAPESPDYSYVRIGSELWGSDYILGTTERAVRMTADFAGAPLLVIERVVAPGAEGSYAAAPQAVADSRYQAFGYETCNLVLPPTTVVVGPPLPPACPGPIPVPVPPPPGC